MFNVSWAMFDKLVIIHPLLLPHAFCDVLHYCGQGHKQPVSQGGCLSKATGRGTYAGTDCFKELCDLSRNFWLADTKRFF